MNPIFFTMGVKLIFNFSGGKMNPD